MKSGVVRALVIALTALGVGACDTSNGARANTPSVGEYGGERTVVPTLGAPIRALDGETVGVACGVCIYGMEGGDDCPLAAEIGEEKYYFVTLKLKGEFDTHDVGLCDAASKARVTGYLHKQGVVVTTIELLPEM